MGDDDKLEGWVEGRVEGQGERRGVKGGEKRYKWEIKSIKKKSDALGMETSELMTILEDECSD